MTAAKTQRGESARDTVSSAICKAMRLKGWTQADLAGAVRRSQSVVSRWCAGKSLPDVTTLAEIGAALGVQPWRLLDPEFLS